MVGNVQYAEFRLDEIFDITRGVRVTKANQEPGDIPYVTAFTSNNGIDSYIDNPPFIQNTILTASFLGDVFYHPYDVSYKDGTYGLKFKEGIAESDRLYLYFAQMIEKIAKSTASYSQNMILKDYESMILQLPTTLTGQPDFDFMENCIKEIEQKHIKKLESDLATRTENLLTVIGREDLVGDPDGLAAVVDKGFDDRGVEYAEFRVGDLFKIEKTKSCNTNKLTPVFDVEYPYVTRTSLNNGVNDYTGKIEDVVVNEANVFSLGLLGMDFFHQKKEWYAGQFVRKVIPKFNMTDRLALYFKTHLDKQKEELLKVLVRNVDSIFENEMVFKLPGTSQGTPDFEFMEKYTAYIELKFTHTLMQWTKEKELL